MKQRLISASVGIVILVAVLILHKTIVFPIALALVVGIILFELIRAIGGLEFKLATVGVMIYGMFSLLEYLEIFLKIRSKLDIVLLPICLALVFWDYMRHPKNFLVEQGAFMIASMILVPYSIKFLILFNFQEHGLFYVMLALCGAWIADSGAYFSGIALGKHKLCPEISPKKTIEGFVGGLISNAVIFVLIFLIYAKCNAMDFNIWQGLKSALLGLVCAGVSVLGDLTASVIKRQKGIKDYGNIMPGHGGLMDRFDSVLFVIPAFYTCIKLFPIF
ncbi:MAG: phosphatidate cytidylyltransferase [Oscillospiraceae bacterium]|nr:phosphatidate cytidylyltransferase [Ruminococcus sp.]MDE6708851.1 phosphatidate cytidylyltransferase [Oscillospiraceae bacterium]